MQLFLSRIRSDIDGLDDPVKFLLHQGFFCVQASQSEVMAYRVAEESSRILTRNGIRVCAST